MLSGFLKPSAGEVTVLGEPVWENPALYRRLGLVPERESVYGSLTGYEFVRLNARLQGLADPEGAARRRSVLVDLEEAADRSTGGYSKGMKQRIKVAAALVHDPAVLLLDEPFNGADPRQRLHMIDLFRRLAADGRTSSSRPTSWKRSSGSPSGCSWSLAAGSPHRATSARFVA